MDKRSRFGIIRYLVCILAVFLFFGIGAYAFDDVGNEDMESIRVLVDKGIICGRGDGLFHGGDSLTRAEAVALLARSMGIEDMEALSPSLFTDIEGHWAEDTISLYWSLGLVDGKTGKVFDPDDYVSYRQWAKLMLDLEGYGNDAQALGGYPEGYMALAAERGWQEPEGGAIDRITVARMLADHFCRPLELKEVMTVRSDNEISLSRCEDDWAAARWRIYYDSGAMLTASRVEFEEDKSRETVQKAVSSDLKLDRLGKGRYSLRIEMLDRNDTVIDESSSRIIVLARDLEAAADVPVLKMDVIRLSQGYGGEGGHKGTYAIDLIGRDDGADALCAPFDGTIKKIYSEGGSQNFVWLESDRPQTLANGKVGYVTVMTGHDSHTGDLFVGKRIKKGDAYYHEGVSGAARGNHIHLEAGFSKATDEGWVQNEYGRWEISASIPPEHVFLLDDSVTWVHTKASYDIEFKYLE